MTYFLPQPASPISPLLKIPSPYELIPVTRRLFPLVSKETLAERLPEEPVKRIGAAYPVEVIATNDKIKQGFNCILYII